MGSSPLLEKYLFFHLPFKVGGEVILTHLIIIPVKPIMIWPTKDTVT